MYLPRHLRGLGLTSVEQEYKPTRIIAAVNLYQKVDPVMRTDPIFEA